MDEGWVAVYSSALLYRAEIVRQILIDNSIPAFLLNKQDSSYLFGEINICVKQADVIRAKHVINKIEF